jgi:hypothetical protein
MVVCVAGPMDAHNNQTDGSLGDAILKVGIDSTEGELLPCIMACLSESIVVEMSVVTVVMEDLDSMLCSILLKGKLGSESFVRLVVKLEVDESKVAEVVDKDGGALVALLGKFALQLCIKTYLCQCHLIHQDALSRFGCNKYLVVGLGFLALPGKLGHRAKQTSCTLGRQHLGKLLQDLAVEGKLFEFWKGKMTKVVMQLHELGLFVGGQELEVLRFFGRR